MGHKKRMLSGNKIRFLVLIFVTVSVVYLYSFFKVDTGYEENFQEMFNRSYSVYALQLPDNIDFAGERVPMEYFDVKEHLDRELLVNTYWQSSTLLLIKRANRYFPMIERILEENEVPDDFKYLALAESGLMQSVSPKGAVGFWQFLRNTAKEYGLEVNSEVDERYNIEKSTKAACEYFKKAYEKFGTWTMAAASYNRGRAGLIKQIDRQDEDNYYNLLLNEETARYLYRIISFKLILNDPAKYGFNYKPEDLYPPIRTRSIEVDSTINSMVGFARHFNLNYKTLKLFNPWLRETKLTNSKGKKYYIQIPFESFRTDSYTPKIDPINLY